MLFFIFCLAQTSNNEVIVHTSNPSEPKAQTALNGLLFLDSFLFERMLKTHSSPSHLLFLFADKKKNWHKGKGQGTKTHFFRQRMT